MLYSCTYATYPSRGGIIKNAGLTGLTGQGSGTEPSPALADPLATDDADVDDAQSAATSATTRPLFPQTPSIRPHMGDFLKTGGITGTSGTDTDQPMPVEADPLPIDDLDDLQADVDDEEF